MRYEVTFSYDTKAELELFLKDYQAYEQWKYKRLNKKDTDKRGKSTKQLHELAKQIKEVFPDRPYKQCLKEAGKTMKESSKVV